MGARLHSWWQQIKRPLLVVGIIAASVLVIVLMVGIIGGYLFSWNWTGLGPFISPPHPKDSDFQRGKTLWDWLQLLIIPAVLAIAGYVINLTISRSEQEATKQRAQSEREEVKKHAETEREIALDNQREEALQGYIDKISELMLHENLRESELGDAAVMIARARTLTVLPGLNARRKGNVIEFLYESDLVGRMPFIPLHGVNLNDAILPYARLNGAFFDGAQFHRACLIGANLSNAILFATDLSGADLSGANIGEADLSDANLLGAIVTDEQLATTKSLKGATMPDGSKHP